MSFPGRERLLPAACALAAALGLGSGCAAAAPRGGASATPFLTMGAGARAAGLGDAQAALVDDASALFVNPAALTRIPSLSLTAFHAPYIDGSAFGAAAYGHNLGRAGVLGVGLQYASAGRSDRVDETGTVIGSVRPRDSATEAGYAYRLHGMDRLWRLNGFSGGAAVKRVSSRVVDGQQALAMDLGLLSAEAFDGRFRWGASALNLGGRLGDDPLPREFRVGGAWKSPSRWRVAMDAVSPSGGGPFLSSGLEYGFPVRGRLGAAVRVGYDTRWAGGHDGISGLTAGFGLSGRMVSLDYFFRFQGNGWTVQGFSLSWGFGARDGLPEHVQELLEDGRRLMGQNRFAEAVLKFNAALTELPSCKEAQEGLEEAAQNLQ